MQKELPNYVFENRYSNFYLLTEFDIIFNGEFTDKLNVFLKSVNSKNIIIILELHDEYQSVMPKEIILSNNKDLNDFYEMKMTIDGNDTFYYMFNFYIRDETKLWEIYVSLENELSIIGCSDELDSLFKIIFNPYVEENLEKKQKIIGDKFINNDLKTIFFKSLEQNYSFDKNKY